MLFHNSPEALLFSCIMGTRVSGGKAAGASC